MGRNNTAFQLNGYSYADSKIEFNGIELPGVTAFSFTETQAKNNNYGMGKNAVSRSRGKVEQEGSVELDVDTMNIVSSISPTNKIIDVPAGIMIFSLEKSDGGRLVYTFPFFEFMGEGVTGSEGDENLTMSIDTIFGSFTKVEF